jgi:hypothetical protein
MQNRLVFIFVEEDALSLPRSIRSVPSPDLLVVGILSGDIKASMFY